MQRQQEIDKDTINRKKQGKEYARKSGRLKSASLIILQTECAQKIFYGQRHLLLGVKQFSQYMTKIWHAASNDDPYADQYLIKIYEGIYSERAYIKKLLNKHQVIMNSEPGLEMNMVFSSDPKKIPLHFTTPYGYMVSYLLADYDRLVRLMLSIRFMGLPIDEKPNVIIKQVARRIRRVLSLSMQWVDTGVTRIDITENSALAQMAIKKMGEIDGNILAKKIRSPHAPNIYKKSLQIKQKQLS